MKGSSAGATDLGWNS